MLSNLRNQEPSFLSAAVAAFERTNITFSELKAWLVNPETLELPIHQVESDLVKQGRELLRQLLEAHIRSRGTGHHGPVVLVSSEGKDEKFEEGREHTRHLKTVLGSVKIQRQAYSCQGESSVHPLDRKLSLPHRSFSYEMQRRVVKETAKGPMSETIESLEDLSSISIGKGSVETIVQEAAVDFDDFYEQREVPKPEETGSILVAEADGKGIPMIKPVGTVTPGHRTKGQKANKKKMATMAVVYTIKPRKRTPEEVTESLFKDRTKLVPLPSAEERAKTRPKPEHKRVWASLKKGKAGILQEAAAECERRDPHNEKIRAAVTDGERALQDQVKSALPGFEMILDIMHALPRLWTVAHIFYDEGSTEALSWVKERTLKILQGDVVNVVRGIRISATKRGLEGKPREKIDKATNYLRKNRERMQYQKYLAQGLPIATGNIEGGGARHLVKDRMERAGMRWSEDGAESVVALRALYINGDLDDYWDFHIRREQERLYSRKIQLLPKAG